MLSKSMKEQPPAKYSAVVMKASKCGETADSTWCDSKHLISVWTARASRRRFFQSTRDDGLDLILRFDRDILSSSSKAEEVSVPDGMGRTGRGVAGIQGKQPGNPPCHIAYIDTDSLKNPGSTQICANPHNNWIIMLSSRDHVHLSEFA